MKALKKYRWPLTGALLGVLVFLAVYGVRVLDPTSVDWILNSLSPDPIQHYLGWELFRRSPVHLPYIGANYNADKVQRLLGRGPDQGVREVGDIADDAAARVLLDDRNMRTAQVDHGVAVVVKQVVG